jgi:hypothetical protein
MIKPLSQETWDAFAALGKKHNGVWDVGTNHCVMRKPVRRRRSKTT